MRRMLGVALMAALCPANATVAQETQTIYLASRARVGQVELPRGICEVSWGTASGSRVQMIFKTEDKETFRVPARMVEGMQDRTGVITSVVNGVTYLRELHTQKAKFVFQSRRDGSK